MALARREHMIESRRMKLLLPNPVMKPRNQKYVDLDHQIREAINQVNLDMIPLVADEELANQYPEQHQEMDGRDMNVQIGRRLCRHARHAAHMLGGEARAALIAGIPIDVEEFEQPGGDQDDLDVVVQGNAHWPVPDEELFDVEA